MTPKLDVQEIHDTIPGMRPEPPVTPYDPRRSSRAGNLGFYCAMQTERDTLLHLVHELIHQRDALARRCAEQARHIAGLISLKAEEAADPDAHPIADAIATMQKQGVR